MDGNKQRIVDDKEIIVHGILGIEKDVLELFFENEKRSGGGIIENIQINEEEDLAIITYSDLGVVERVLKKGPTFKIGSQKVTVECPPKLNQRAIIVEGIHKETSLELLELFFENRRKSSGGDIEQIQYEEGSGKAVITFQNVEVAQRVLSKKNLSLSDTQLRISPVTSEHLSLKASSSVANTATVVPDPRVIYVTGIPADMDEEKPEDCTIMITNLPKITENHLKLAIEKKTGAKPYCMTFYPEELQVKVKLEQSKGTRDLLQKKYLLLEEVKCPVIALYTQVHDECEGSLAIMVSGLSESITDDTLNMYFNNRRRSGGYNVRSIFRNERDKKAVISFECVEAVTSVLGMQRKQKLTLKGQDLHVESLQSLPPPPLVDEPTEPDKLIMTRAPPVCKEDVEAFLCCPNQEGNSDSRGVSIKKMLYSWKRDSIFIVFSEKIDYNAMLKICVIMPLKDRMVTLKKVSLPTMVQVSASEPLDKEELELYFESKKCGADGEILDITVYEELCCVVIDYGNNRIVQSILQKTHKIGGTTVKVVPFYPDFGICPYDYDPSQPWSIVPDPFRYRIEDQYAGKFVLQMPSAWKLVNDIGFKNGFEINKEKSTECELFIYYKDNEDGNPPDQAIWQKTCKDKLDQFYNTILTKPYTLETEIFDTILEKIMDMASKNDDILLDISKQHSVIIITGWQPCVKSLEDRIQTLEEEVTRQKKSLDERITLEEDVITIIKAKQYDVLLKDNFPMVQMKFIDGALSLAGLLNEVREIKLYIYENFVSKIIRCLWKCSELRRNFIQKKDVHSFLTSEIKKAKIVVVWNIKNSEVILSAMTKQELEAGQKILEEAIVEQVIDLKKENLEVINSPAWTALKMKLKNDLGDVVLIEEDVGKQRFQLLITSDRFVAVREEIQSCLDENSILTAEVDVVRPVVQLITKFHLNEIKNIKISFERHRIDIHQHDRGFLVQCNKFVLQSAVQAVQNLCHKVVSEDHQISRPGMKTFFNSEKGKQAISVLEAKHKVICVDPDDIEPITVKHSSHVVDNSSDILYTSTISEGRTVKVLIGDITKQKVDVIVNAANDQLLHQGGLAAAIVKAGGEIIQEECSSHVQRKGRLLAGEVFTSSAGNLPCRLVAHAVGPKWNGGQMGEINELFEAIFASLEEAEKASMKSIAIPAVSSGIFGFPLNKATDIICEAIKEYFQQKVSSKISEVCLIDNQEKGGQSFLRSAQTYFSTGKSHLTRKGDIPKEDEAFVSNMLISATSNTLRTKEGISITLKQGSLPDEQVDVLLNSTQKDLNLGAGGVSAILLKAAGPVIQQECNNIKPSSLNPGDIIVTSGGNLNVKSIFHGYCNPWKGNSNEMDLRALISNALIEAEQHNYVSLALPAVGTGYLKYPRHIVAKVIVEEIVSFSQQHPRTKLKDVRIVLFPQDLETIQAFQNFWKSPVQQEGGARHKERRIKTMERKKTTESVKNVSDVKYTVLKDSPQCLLAKIGIIKFSVMKDDITKLKVDAIMNSTDRQFSEQGNVAKAIFKAGGEELKNECKIILTSSQLTDVAITGGGQLNCRSVIHVNVTSLSIKELLFRAFQLAERNGISCLAMPALGTGMLKKTPKEVCHDILKAITEFEESEHPISLKEIQLVLYDSSSYKDFRKHVISALSGKETGWLSYMKGLFSKLNPFNTKESGVNAGFMCRIYAMDKEVVDVVIKELDEICNSESKRHIFDKEDEQEAIVKMSKVHEEEIKSLETKHNVSITIHKGIRLNRIIVEGYSDSFVTCVAEITKALNKVQTEDLKEDMETIIHRQVQWQYQDSDHFKLYPKEINYIIEKAYLAKKQSATWEEEIGSVEVLFKEMKERKNGDPKTDTPVKRTTLNASATIAVDLPSTWSPMKADELSCLVKLSTSDAEYQAVAQRFTPGNIQSIERIQNPKLYQMYAVCRQQMEETDPTKQNEMILYHGTAADSLNNINSFGFNRSYCGKNATVYGEGVYFAVDPTYSAHPQYAKPDQFGKRHVYQARVLIGQSTVGQQGLKEPPYLNGSSGRRFDSVHDASRQIYVIFHDVQAYPEYLITFM